MKNFTLFLLFILFTSFSNLKAQTTSITYYDLKKMTDASSSEAIKLFKSKGFSFSKANDEEVTYSKEKNFYGLSKAINGTIVLTLYGKNLEKISSDIQNTVNQLEYIEINSYTVNNSFCTKYESYNYEIYFCDSIITYDYGNTDNKYIVIMQKKF